MSEQKELHRGDRIADVFPCIADEVEGKNPCGSSDGMSIYHHGATEDAEEWYDASCWVCKQGFSAHALAHSSVGETFLSGDERERVLRKARPKKRITPRENNLIRDRTLSMDDMRNASSPLYRGLKGEYLAFFAHRLEYKDGDLFKVYYPETQKSKFMGYKPRHTQNKDFVSPIGWTGVDSDLSGQSLFKGGGKYVAIVGGENDKVALFQGLRDYQILKGQEGYDPIAVVSTTTGEGSAARQCAANYEFLDSFDNIYVGLDNDEAGEEATEALLKVLPAEKVSLITWSMEDPHAMLEAGKEQQMISNFYGAKPLVRQQVKTSKDADDEMEEELLRDGVPLPPFMHKLSDMMAGDIPLGYIVNFIAQTGGGKCHGVDTPILMYDGSIKKVQDFVKGDTLMGPDGTVRNVLGTTKGSETLYRVAQANGDDYTVNASHILSLRAGYDCSKASGILKGDIVNINVVDYLNLKGVAKRSLKGYKGNLVNMNEGHVKHPYLIGLWLADGDTSCAKITVADRDDEIIKEIHATASNYGYTVSTPECYVQDNCKGFSITKGFRNVLDAQLGILRDKHIPLSYLRASSEDRLQLLAGLIDGDGYLHNNCYEIIQKSDKLSENIVWLAKSLGFKVSSTPTFKKCQNFEGGWYNRMVISGDVCSIPLRLTRKRPVNKSNLRASLNTAIKVTEMGVGDYYGFELDGDHLYCLGDFTVTHNTTFINEMVYHWIFNCPYRVGILSLELNAGQYQTAMLSRHTGVKIQRIKSKEAKREFLNRPETILSRKELREDEYGRERYVLLDERDGGLSQVRNEIEKLIRKYDCKVIIIDPIQDLFEGVRIEDQSAFIKYLKGISKGGIAIVNVCHITKAPSRTDAKGNRIRRKLTEDDVAGVSNLVKSGAANIFFDRDKYADTELGKNTTEVYMPKCRWTGDAGEAGEWFYDNKTHTVYELEDWLKLNPEDEGEIIADTPETTTTEEEDLFND